MTTAPPIDQVPPPPVGDAGPEAFVPSNAPDRAHGGFTVAEFAVWRAVCDAAALYLALTESSPQNPMEREEICHAFHDIQARLASRPTMRALMGRADDERSRA